VISLSNSNSIAGLPASLLGGGTPPVNLDFVSTWDTTKAGSASDTVVLPMTAGLTVHWGDGNTDTTNTHTYAFGGTYTITIEGAVDTFRFNNSGDKLKITDISNWGGFDVSNDRIFRGCSNLDITATDYPIISTTSFAYMFANCVSLTSPNFSSWNVSNVTGFGLCFNGCSLFNGNLGNWDFSSATSSFGMDRFLSGCSVFNNSSVLTWNLNGVGGMPSALRGTLLFNQPIGAWDVSSVTRMDNMFNNADSFDQDISAFDINQVSNFSNFMLSATGLSTANYDALLIAWDAQGAMSYSGTVNFGGSKYTSGGEAEAARTNLILKWGGGTIIDGGAA
jgi:surface protein